MFTKMIAVVTSISLVSRCCGTAFSLSYSVLALSFDENLYLSFEEFGDSRENCRLRSVCPMIS